MKGASGADGQGKKAAAFGRCPMVFPRIDCYV
jgi:hypothetical protein